MEHRFGTRFADVRIHAEGAPQESALRWGARAYTEGRDIYFAPGWWSPETRLGRALLAHELAHVVQQRNGRFPADGPDPGRSRLELEREAERVERSVLASGAPVSVHGQADGRGPFFSPGLFDDLLGEVSGGLAALADHVVERAGGDPMVAELQRLRSQWAWSPEVMIRLEELPSLEARYRQVRSWAPGWLPLPRASFAGPEMQAAAVVIPIAALILFLIVLWWVIMGLNPEVRRAREQAWRDLFEHLKRALAPRGPVPKPPDAPTRPKDRPAQEPRVRPDPRQRPRPDDPPPPVPIDPTTEVTDKDRRRRGCRVFLCPDLGDDPLASLYCDAAAPGTPFPGVEYRVYPPGAVVPLNPCSEWWTGWAQYDAKHGNVVYECKCGYAGIVEDYNSGDPRRRARAELRLSHPDGLDRQMRLLLRVAGECGLTLRYIVSNAGFQQLLTERWGVEPVVLCEPFDPCD